jgi:hypothetical protein
LKPEDRVWLVGESGFAGPGADDVAVFSAARLTQSPKANMPTKDLMDNFMWSSIVTLHRQHKAILPRSRWMAKFFVHGIPNNHWRTSWTAF